MNTTSTRRSVLQPLEARRLFVALDSGQVINGTIGSSSEVDSYTIDVAAGAPFLVALEHAPIDANTLTPHLKVLAPNGSTLIDENVGEGLSRIVPTATTGTYQVQVRAAANTGAYTLAAFRPTANVGEPDLLTAVSGRRYTGSLVPGDIDVFRMSSAGYESYGATAMEATPGIALDPRVTLIDGHGHIIGNVAGEIGAHVDGRYPDPEELPAYAIVADDGNNDGGDYGFTMTRVPGVQDETDPDTASLAPGAIRTGTLLAGEMDVFTIPRVPDSDDSTIIITLTRANGSTIDPDVTYYDGNGAEVARGTRTNGNATSRIAIAYPRFSSDPSYIVVREWESDEVGDYTLSYTVEERVPPITLVAGVLRIDGTAEADLINVYQTEREGVMKVAVDYFGYPTTSFYDASDVQRVEVFGGDGDDELSLYATLTKSARVSAGAGSDTVLSESSGDTTFTGGEGNDLLSGGSGNDYLTGGSGEDHISGGGGDDSLTGGSGRNRLFGGEGSDLLRGSNGRDFLHGEAGNDRLYGEPGNDYLNGGGNKDRLSGGDGEDQVDAGGSNDQIYGGLGNDTLSSGRGADNVDGGDGIDLLLDKEDGDVLINIETGG